MPVVKGLEVDDLMKVLETAQHWEKSEAALKASTSWKGACRVTCSRNFKLRADEPETPSGADTPAEIQDTREV